MVYLRLFLLDGLIDGEANDLLMNNNLTDFDKFNDCFATGEADRSDICYVDGSVMLLNFFR